MKTGWRGEGMVSVDLRIGSGLVDEIDDLAIRLGLEPGDVISLGVASLGLWESIHSRKGQLIAEYPGGFRTEVHLPEFD